MKKKILCLALALLLVLPIILSSCSDIRSDEEIIADILGGEDAPKALTLSLWIPTKSDTDSDKFNERLVAVENAINEILVEKNYTTQIDIVAVDESEYEKKLQERFESMKQLAGPGQAYADGLKFKNEIDYYYPDKDNTEDFIYTLKYPKVLDYQLDLFLIRGYDNLINYYNMNVMSDKIDSYTKSGAAYSNITKLIRPSILNQMRLNGKIYAIPNNHLYADEYQYLLINKNIFDSLNLNISDINDVYSCEEFIKAVGNAVNSGELSNVIPFVGTMDDAPNSMIYDSNLMIGAGLNEGSISDIFSVADYKKYVSFYKRLEENGFVSTSNNGSDVAVQFVYGTTSDVEELYADDYYLVKSRGPVATADTIFESMFAISSYSIEYERAMKFLYLLQSDVEVRTLLQYGIEGVDYTVAYDSEAGENVIKVKEDTAYKMDVLYTGNGYYTYPEDGAGFGAWDEIKDTNKDVVVDPFICYEEILNSNKVSESEKKLLAENKLAVISLIQSYVDTINGMTSEEFEKFASIDFATIVWEDLAFYKEEMGYEKEDMLDSLESDYSALEKKISKIQNDDDKSQDEKDAEIAEIKREMSLISAAAKEILNYRVSEKDINKVVDKYKAEIEVLNKEIEEILNDEELDEEEKQKEIAYVQKDIDEINDLIAYYSITRNEEESEVKSSIVQGMIDYLNAEIEKITATEDYNVTVVNEYQALVKYLSNEIAQELGNEYYVLSDEELENFVELLPELTDLLEDIYNEIDSSDLSSEEIDIKLNAIDEMVDYIAFLEEIKEYEIVINEFLADIDVTLIDTKGYEFVVELYDSEEYKFIIDFYSKLSSKK